MFNRYFDDVYCINLDRRTDRWEECLNEFRKIGIDSVNRFSAVDGMLITKFNGLSTGEVGALRSHLEIFRLAKQRGLKSVLILEDDVEFAPDFQNKFLEYYSQVPDNWDMLYLGANHAPCRFQMISTNVARIFHSYAIHAYAVKQNLFDKIIERLEKEEKQVDVYLAELQSECNAFVFRPHIAFQRDNYSDIAGENVKYDFLRY